METVLAWEEGQLVSRGPDAVRAWRRPGDLAETRLACAPSPAALALEDGAAVLKAVFTVVPFARGPLPPPVYGAGVTPAARAAFDLFLDRDGTAGDLRVLRGMPDDFLVFARYAGARWAVGACTVASTTLTVRVEDIWRGLPDDRRAGAYRIDVLRDPHAKDDATGDVVRETLDDVAPDARIFIDLARGGGFVLRAEPLEGTTT